MRKAQKKSASASQILAMILFSIFFTIAFIFSAKIGIERQAKADCLKWQSWDNDYVMFEPSANMLNECRTLGVDLKN